MAVDLSDLTDKSRLINDSSRPEGDGQGLEKRTLNVEVKATAGEVGGVP